MKLQKYFSMFVTILQYYHETFETTNDQLATMFYVLPGGICIEFSN